jgi:hypothetical protein
LRYAGPSPAYSDTTNLADLLERILDKGIVIAGDISISLIDVEVLTIKLRLLIASVDKAQEMGINWWRSDPWLSGQSSSNGQSSSADESDDGQAGDANGGHPELEERLERIEAALERLSSTGTRTRNAKSSRA